MMTARYDAQALFDERQRAITDPTMKKTLAKVEKTDLPKAIFKAAKERGDTHLYSAMENKLNPIKLFSMLGILRLLLDGARWSTPPLIHLEKMQAAWT